MPVSNDYSHQHNGGPHYINAGPGRDYLEIYMKHALDRLATILCGTGNDTINYARPGARSCEHTKNPS